MELLSRNGDIIDIDYENNEDFSDNQRKRIAAELVRGELFDFNRN